MATFQMFFVFSLLGIITGNPAPRRDQILRHFQMVSEECRREVGATTVDLQHLLNRIPPAGMAGKCLRSCIMKKYNVMDSCGKFVASRALDEARRLTSDMEKMKVAVTMIRACSDIRVSDNDCEAAAEYDCCFREQAKAMGLPQY